MDVCASPGAERTPLEDALAAFARAQPEERSAFLDALARQCTVRELSHLEARIRPRLQVDFLSALPPEVGMHVLSFIDDPAVLARAARVNRAWNRLAQNELLWVGMCVKHGFNTVPKWHWLVRALLPEGALQLWSLSTAMPPAQNGRAAAPHDAAVAAAIAGATSPQTPRPKRRQRSSSGSVPAPWSPSQPPPVARPRKDASPYKLDSLSSALQEAVPPSSLAELFSFRSLFQLAYMTETNWLRGGRLLSSYVSVAPADADPNPDRRLALTFCAVQEEYIVVAMTNANIYAFSARTGELVHVLKGHRSGVWCLMLVSGTRSHQRRERSASSAAREPPPGAPLTPPHAPVAGAANGLFEAFRDTRESAMLRPPGAGGSLAMGPQALQAFFDHGSRDEAGCASVRGWGNADTKLVSAGSDRALRVWNLRTGACELVLHGHTSTVRCLQVLEGRPVAVSGSRDGTLRVWDLETGATRHVLAGHQHSVRCLDTAGNRVASGSYDYTCRIWDVDTGRCLHLLKGHYLEVYAIAFDGRYVVSGSSDSTVRVWDAATGANLAVFQGYTHVVAQLQLHNGILATGGGDGRVIVFDLNTLECLYRLCAHDSSVSTLQMDDRFLVTGSSDGVVKLWDARTGRFLRQLCDTCETVWNVSFLEDKCVVLCKRHGKCAVETYTYLPLEEEVPTAAAHAAAQCAP